MEDARSLKWWEHMRVASLHKPLHPFILLPIPSVNRCCVLCTESFVLWYIVKCDSVHYVALHHLVNAAVAAVY